MASGSAAPLSVRPWGDRLPPHPKERMPQSKARELELMA
jgi:hypothetical protein